jgi:DNA invertase Pin-like site-specific DNA recombinase
MSDSKITAEHRQRDAYVYVRQSTIQQTRQRLQGKERQYELDKKAEDLGFAKVVVIDDDLGRSGTGVEYRPGFGKLLSAVCDGKVGAVFALEASRLARNSRDWHHLIDLCSLTNTLVIDADGIYDPKLVNDRLLLGLKGSMSEFELSIFRQRARESMDRVVARGDVVMQVPIGYVRLGRRMEMTPDVQVQQAIRTVFGKFRELGSARQVVLWFRQEGLKTPYYKREEEEFVEAWRDPIYSHVLSMIRNPVYAGAFAYGKTTTRQSVVEGRPVKSSGHRVPMSEWRILIKDHHEPFISWADYVHHQETLTSNGTQYDGSKAPKNGDALLSGLVRCKRCGSIVHTQYCGTRPHYTLRYICRGKERHQGQWKCISFAGAKVDSVVSEHILEAVQPAAVDAAIEAWEHRLSESNETRQALQLSLQKAEYEAELARRRFDKVDPDNRLVAQELERRWNAALQEASELRHRLELMATEELFTNEELRERLFDLGNDFEAAWNHPSAPVTLKKRIVRTVIREVVADVSADAPEILLWIHWYGGRHTHLKVRKNRTGVHERSTDRDVVELIEELAKVCQDKDTAAILNRLGYRTGPGETWTSARVCAVRNYRKIPPMPRKADRPWITLYEAAELLEISQASVRKLIKQNVLPGKQVVCYAPWVIDRADLDRNDVQEAAGRIRRSRRAAMPSPNQQDLPFNS